MKKITTLAESYLALRLEVEELEKLLKSAEAELLVAMESSGATTSIVSGHKITLVSAARSTYNVEALKDLVSAALYKRITKPAVDSKKFKAAVELGEIKPDVADAVTTTTPYKSIRVTSALDSTVADEKPTKKTKVA